MPGARDIKRRIKSTGSTKKITRAMQMVSAVKMRKAQQAALASRAYSDTAWQIVTNLSHLVDPKYHALLQPHEPEQKNGVAAESKIGVLLITTNRGLVGGFNVNLLTALNRFALNIKERTGSSTEIITLGRKGRDAVLRQGARLVAEFEKSERAPSIHEITPISKLITEEYLKGTYNKIVIAYTHYISIVNQKPVIKTLLPFEKDSAGKFTDMSGKEELDLPVEFKKYLYDYIFEPSPQEVLDKMLPRIIEAQLYQAILESDASEHSARMVMMKNATDAASDLIDDLTLMYNQIRQANITKELAEITAGKIALE